MSLYNTLNINLIEELGLTNLSDQDQEKLVKEMEGIISERILVAAMSLLTDDQLSEIELIEEPEKLLNYLADNLPNFQMLVAEVIADFKEEMLSLNEIANEEIDKRFADSK